MALLEELRVVAPVGEPRDGAGEAPLIRPAVLPKILRLSVAAPEVGPEVRPGVAPGRRRGGSAGRRRGDPRRRRGDPRGVAGVIRRERLGNDGQRAPEPDMGTGQVAASPLSGVTRDPENAV